MVKSIMPGDVEGRCYLCGHEGWTERHHIIGGGCRKRSDRDGLTVYLCHWCHNEYPNGVHQNREKMDALRAAGQKAWMEHYGKTVEDFIAAYGRNYL